MSVRILATDHFRIDPWQHNRVWFSLRYVYCPVLYCMCAVLLVCNHVWLPPRYHPVRLRMKEDMRFFCGEETLLHSTLHMC